MSKLKTISMELDKDWLLASLNAKVGGSFTLVRKEGGKTEGVCVETSFLSKKGGVTITLSTEESSDG